VREHSYVSVRVCVWLQTGEKHIDVVYLVHMFVSVCVCVCVGELPRIHLQHICAHISESSRRPTRTSSATPTSSNVKETIQTLYNRDRNNLLHLLHYIYEYINKMKVVFVNIS